MAGFAGSLLLVSLLESCRVILGLSFQFLQVFVASVILVMFQILVFCDFEFMRAKNTF